MRPRHVALALLTVLQSVLVVLAISPQARVGVKTFLLIPQLLPGAPVRPLMFLTPAPSKSEVRYGYGEEERIADLYRPAGGGRHGAIILFLGVNPAGREDPRVVRLASGLARIGLVVLVPYSQDMVDERVKPQEVGALVAAFQYLEQQPFVAPGRVGFAGFCVGASLAVVAAEDQRINKRVRFVNDFDGYYDLRDYIVEIVTKSFRMDSTIQAWEPDDLAQRVVTRELIENMPAPEDRAELGRVFINGEPLESLNQDVITPDGQVLYQLLTSTDEQEAYRLLAQLPPSVEGLVAPLSPSSDIGGLQAKLFVMHDRRDDLVPYVESRRLVAAVDGNVPIHYTEFSFFQHVDPTRHVPPATLLHELWKLYRHLYGLMRLALG
ncbi:MAG: dienelactone hydrolase family protein [Chloroflexi bacterium]|nr:dienelactone hydrolase family protein [Chloroflexota bacterium]